MTNQDINTITYALNLAVDLGKLKPEARDRVLAAVTAHKGALSSAWVDGANCALTDVPVLIDYDALLVEHTESVMAQNPYKTG